MTLPVIAIRPEPGCSATAAAGRAIGLTVECHPLFAIQPLEWDAPDPSSVGALLVGSANAFRHGGAGLAAFAGKPAHVVGEATAQAARQVGFTVASVGTGGLQDVVRRLPPGTSLLRLAGEEHVPLDLPPGVTMVTRIVYHSRHLPMQVPLAWSIGKGAVVLLHSAVAAEWFAEECDRLSVPRGSIRLAALGPRIAVAAGEGWAACTSADVPRDGALLALAREMCQ